MAGQPDGLIPRPLERAESSEFSASYPVRPLACLSEYAETGQMRSRL
jgi:hypothetical protein